MVPGSPPDQSMRIPDDSLSSVFFLGVDVVDDARTSRVRYRGTGFYVRVQNESNPELHRLYFVTARHNIEQSREEPGALFVRVNTEDGGSVLSEVSKWDWTFHDDPTVDVAVLAPTFAHQADRTLQHTYIEADSCVTAERIRAYDIGVGTAIAIIGLFNQREGNERNVPIVRVGHHRGDARRADRRRDWERPVSGLLGRGSVNRRPQRLPGLCSSPTRASTQGQLNRAWRAAHWPDHVDVPDLRPRHRPLPLG